MNIPSRASTSKGHKNKLLVSSHGGSTLLHHHHPLQETEQRDHRDKEPPSHPHPPSHTSLVKSTSTISALHAAHHLYHKSFPAQASGRPKPRFATDAWPLGTTTTSGYGAYFYANGMAHPSWEATSNLFDSFELWSLSNQMAQFLYKMQCDNLAPHAGPHSGIITTKATPSPVPIYDLVVPRQIPFNKPISHHELASLVLDEARSKSRIENPPDTNKANNQTKTKKSSLKKSSSNPIFKIFHKVTKAVHLVK